MPAAHFFPFFFLDGELDVEDGAGEAGASAGASGSAGTSGAAGALPASTRTVSSSLADFPAEAFSADSSSSSCMSSVSIVARRFSHHSFSSAVLSCISPSFFRNCVFTAISFADWKMNWPQLGARPLAWEAC